MIPYVEVLTWDQNKTFIVRLSVVEPSECWFELSYYEIGQFEVYAPATSENLDALQKGRFVKIPNRPYLWIITALSYTFNADGARMISATGYEAKWIVGKRVIQEPRSLPSTLMGAMDLLFVSNIKELAEYSRRINGISSDFSACDGIMTDQAQATRENLLSFMQNLLKQYACGTISTYSEENRSIIFSAVKGTDKSATITFSQSLDNLISSTFYTSDENEKTDARIVSSFSENNETIEYVADYPEYGGADGIDRAEIVVNSNLSTKVKNPDGTETDLSPTDPVYIAMQRAEGAAALAEQQTVTSFEGEIDLAYSGYVFGVPSENDPSNEKFFFLGDIIGIRDEFFGIASKARVLKYTFKTDASGYGELADYGTE